MSDTAVPLPPPTSQKPAPGTVVSDGKGRTFPCEGCGADLTFHIGQQQLKCPFCGFEKQIAIEETAAVVEQDYQQMLARLVRIRRDKEAAKGKQNRSPNNGSPDEASVEQLDDSPDGKQEVRCDGCGATVEFIGSLTSSRCPYCDTPLQRENVHDAADRIPADGVLPFLIDHDTAAKRLADWVTSRWFAPNEFTKYGVEGRFSGVYLPYWTFDSMTSTAYRGQRGDHYYVEVREGNETKRERRTSWTPVNGAFQRFFDDVLIIASRGLREDLVQALEPWPLEKVVPFNQQMLAGYLARTYETELEQGFETARRRIDEAIESEIRERIGGDEQQIQSKRSHYDAVTFKHLLLPLWLLAYRYHGNVYQVLINAATGEVQGERPYSWIKISLATLLAAIVAIGLYLLVSK